MIFEIVLKPKVESVEKNKKKKILCAKGVVSSKEKEKKGKTLA